MIIEQATLNLPEILVGSGYAKQEYEAGIVSGLSLAILQELNGRGIANPISCLCAERRYPNTGKNLRADLHVRLDRLYSGSRAYSEFGFRYSNWLEAKFFRSGSGTPPSTQNLGTVVADLIRLIALVPIELAKDKDGDDTKYTVTGRYLLHAYFGKPLNHLNPTRKAKGSKPREWVEPLLRPGQVTIDDFELSDETDAFFKHLGHGFRDATIKVNLTNIVLSPIKPPKDNFYTVVLSRIDSASFSLGGQSLKLNADRTVEFTSKTELDQMRLNVASTLKPAKSEKDTAIEDEEDADQ